MRLTALALVAISFAVVRPVCADVRYIITDLGTLGGRVSWGTDVNNLGQVTGSSRSPGYYHAFIHDGTTMHDLGTLPGDDESHGRAINDAAVVVGGPGVGSTIGHAFLYDGATMHDLGTLGGASSTALGINNAGLVVGTSHLSSGAFSAFLYDGTTMRDLGVIGRGSKAWDINDAGLVTGDTFIDGIGSRAFIYDGSTTLTLGTLGGTASRGLAISNSGLVVGDSFLEGNSATHAFLYDGTTMHDLGSFGGKSLAHDVNDAGLVVGSVTGSPQRAFLYDGTTMLNLNDLIDSRSGWNLTSASGINESGQITGRGLIGGTPHAYLLTPIPEPSTLLLGVLAAAGLLIRRRKQDNEWATAPPKSHPNTPPQRGCLHTPHQHTD